jgi:hypothetical protein
MSVPNTGDAAGLAQKIKTRVDVFSELRDPQSVKDLFDRHADQSTKLITAMNIRSVMLALGNHVTEDEATVLFQTFDMDENGGLDLQEFKKAIKFPSKVEQWADNLPLSKLLAHCLSFKQGDDPLREVSRLSSDELRAVTNAYCESLHLMLMEAVRELNLCYAEMDNTAGLADAGSKFQTFKMSSGSVEDFHNGLQGRVGESHPLQPIPEGPFSRRCTEAGVEGAPHPILSKGMEEEHCIKAGHSVEFVSINYGVRTTPRKEYEIATGRRACPAEDMLDRQRRTVVRAVRRIQDLKALRLVQKADLTEDEVVAVVRLLPVRRFYPLPLFPSCVAATISLLRD